MKNSYHISRYSFLIFTFLVCSLLYVWIFLHTQPSPKVEEGSYSGCLTSFQIDGDLWSGILTGEHSYLFYRTISTEKEKKWLLKYAQIGSYVTFSGKKEPISSNGNRNLFQKDMYYKTKKIFDQITVKSYHLEDRSIPFRYRMKNQIEQTLSTYSSPYLNAFLFGNLERLEEEQIVSIRKLGISHLFSISGLHFHVFIFLLHFFLKQFIRSFLWRDLIVMTLLFPYGFIVGFSPSVLRVFIFYILTFLCRFFHISCTSLDRFMFTLSVILLQNPYLIFHMGFQFSFGITFLLLYDHKWLLSCRFSKYVLPFYIFFFSFPISIFHFYEVNFLSPIYNLVFVPLVSMILFPLAILTFFVPLLLPLFQVCVSIFESLLCFCGEISFGVVSFARPSFGWIVIYYIVFFWVRRMVLQQKYGTIFILICIIGCHYMKLWFSSDMQYHMIDVGQGDASILLLPHQTSAIMIDTGGVLSFSKKQWQKRKRQSSLTERVLLPYLKSIGVHHIRFFILSHGDYDHMGEAMDLIKKFQVKHVILNCGAYNHLEKELIKVLEKKHVRYDSCIKELNIDGYKLQFLNTGHYDNENDGSSVVYFSYQDFQFLLMGDAGMKRETEILSRYDFGEIDFFKVGHHGSNSSSSQAFIDRVQPRYSLISVGKHNIYGHPKDSVLNILKHSKIYRTDRDGSIEIKINDHQYQIRTGRS